MTKEEKRERDEKIDALVRQIESNKPVEREKEYKHGQRLVKNIKDNINKIYTRE